MPTIGCKFQAYIFRHNHCVGRNISKHHPLPPLPLSWIVCHNNDRYFYIVLLPSSFGDDHLRPHLVKLYPEFPLVQVDFYCLHSLQNKAF